MAQYVKDAKIPFTVIADPDELIYKEYAIERSMQKVMAAVERDDIQKAYVKGQELYNGKVYPKNDEKYDAIINADFLISANRVLEIAYYGEYAGDHIHLDQLYK
jgi:peroxiredoxin Q/BCP